jgi:hypothetical protein
MLLAITPRLRVGLSLFCLREVTDTAESTTNESILHSPNSATVWLAFLLHIREMLRTYLGPEASLAGIFRDFP